MFQKHTETVIHDVKPHYKEMANTIRTLAMDAVEKAQSGHPGMPMGMADVATVLFSEHLKFDPENPHWPDRDRFILSAGHGSMLLYALLYLTGYKDCTLEEIKKFRQLGSKTAGHPEYGYLAGIETTTGPLGQGLANAVGMALAEKMLAARYGKGLVDHYTYVIAGDGCLMEGISHEAISLAGHLQLDKLIVLFDDNHISIDGDTEMAVSDDQLTRFKASGWDVQAVNGHDTTAVSEAIAKAKQSKSPSLIACRTTIAYGAPTKAGTAASHGSPLGAKEIEGAREALGWSYPPFDIPVSALSAWREVAKRSQAEFAAWEKRFQNTDKQVQELFTRTQSGKLPQVVKEKIDAYKRELTKKLPTEATRKSSGNAIALLAEVLPELAGGSADLTGSNLTKAPAMKGVTPKDFSGSYIYYGVREHAMAAAMNGIALHKGLIPYGGTFLVFTDYCRPSIRLSALMKQRVIYVMTHDSIGLGEDGPTHQPVEHLASLRAIPNLHTYRPADAVETLECWQLALEHLETPSVLALSRQNLPTIRKTLVKENLCAKGGYVLSPAVKEAEVTLIATGSEVIIALEAQKALQDSGIAASVVSMPCTTLFDQQDAAYKQATLGKNTVKVAIEAAASYGWERYTGAEGIFVGMPGFGESAPAEALYKHFGITAENIVQKVKKALNKK